jgi:uncharacterized membrane protein YkoI
MMLKRLFTTKAKSVITLMLCGVLVSMPVAAQRFSADAMKQFGEKSIQMAQAGGESLDSAVARIRAQTGGRVLSAETRNEGGVQVHYIRILTKQGKVKNYRVVAQTR